MKVPPLLIGIIALFWAYETNNIIIGVLMFLLIESSIFIKKRWKFDIDDFVKISDMTSLILLSSVVMIVLNNEIEQALLIIQTWLPLIFLPIMITQVYHIEDKIIIATKLGQSKKPAYSHNPMNFSFIYIAITMLSAATANNRGYHFQIILIVFSFWFLLYNKKKKSSKLFFFLATALVLLISFGLNNVFENIYRMVNKKMSSFWESKYSNKRIDPYKSLTAIGNIGKLKDSGKIIMRLISEDIPPRLLKTASYDTYVSANWFSKNKNFNTVKSEKNVWNLYEKKNIIRKSLLIEKYLNNVQTLLPIPYGCFEIKSSDIVKFEINSDKIIKLETRSDLLIYKTIYNGIIIKQIKPEKGNLDIPKNEYETLKKIIDDLELSNLSDKDKLLKIIKFFNKDFSYSLNLKNKIGRSPLSNFLLNSKSGHCEYYATATALLLRTAGIPTKYINGFVIDEKDMFSDKYIIRERHAHAWVEAYIDNRWKVVDTTPSIWLEEDKKETSLEFISDFFSFLRNKITIFIKQNKKHKSMMFLVLILLIIFLFFKKILKFINKKRWLKKSKKSISKNIDTQFVLIIKELEKFEIEQNKNETIISWMYRINKNFPIKIKLLNSIYEIHLKYRFDPNGLTKKENTNYKSQINEWFLNTKK